MSNDVSDQISKTCNRAKRCRWKAEQLLKSAKSRGRSDLDRFERVVMVSVEIQNKTTHLEQLFSGRDELAPTPEFFLESIRHQVALLEEMCESTEAELVKKRNEIEGRSQLED